VNVYKILTSDILRLTSVFAMLVFRGLRAFWQELQFNFEARCTTF